MTRSTASFGDLNETDYLKTGYLHDIWAGTFLAKKMKTGHYKDVVEREKLYPIWVN
jgi:hypothetical protein